MFELIMTYCLAGQPCTEETVANFPQYDVGQQICELAKPAVEHGVRQRITTGARVTFVCAPSTQREQVEYQPREQMDLLDQLPALINQVQGFRR